MPITPIVFATIFALVPACFIYLFIIWLDRYEREPWWMTMGVFLWGAIVATTIAWVLNTLFDISVNVALGTPIADLTTGILSAPTVEEGVKGLAVLVVFFVLRDEFDDTMDGIVYGALAGAGFAMVENIGYFIRAYIQNGGMVGLTVNFFVRVVLGWMGHSVFTACTGAGLGWARETRVRWQKFVAPVLGYGTAWMLHSTHNLIASINNPVVVLLFTNIFVYGATIVLGFVIVRLWRRESRLIATYLASEVATGLVPVPEYALCCASFRRTACEREVLLHRGYRAWTLTKQLFLKETRLAFRKWHVAQGDPRKRWLRQPEDVYRDKIIRLRGALGGSPVPPAFRLPAFTPVMQQALAGAGAGPGGWSAPPVPPRQGPPSPGYGPVAPSRPGPGYGPTPPYEPQPGPGQIIGRQNAPNYPRNPAPPANVPLGVPGGMPAAQVAPPPLQVQAAPPVQVQAAPPVQVQTAATCPRCSANLRPAAKFCHKCGMSRG